MTPRPLTSLRSSDSFRRFVLDQLNGLEVRARSMFGGTGLYSGETFFAIIAADTLYLRVDDTNRGMFEQAGMQPFRPFVNRPVSTKYYAVPLAVLESAAELERWARGAIAAARRAKPGAHQRAKSGTHRPAKSGTHRRPNPGAH
jgi:DNA transformation protein